MAGARQKKMAVALVACLALLVQVSSAAVSHTVGDATGWTQPSSNSFYTSWASKQPSFNVGDFLVFNFPGATQTVAEVTKSAYDSCSAATPITQMNNGPVNLTITTPGPHYYISTDSGHCSAGQKFAITAASPNAPPPTSTPTAPAPKSTPSTSPAAPSPGSTTTPPAAPAPKSSTPSTPGAMTPAASTPTATPAGKGSMAPSTTPTTPSTGAMTPAASPAGKGAMSPSATTTPPTPSGAMTPATAPVASPGSTSMSPTGAPSPTTGTASAPDSGTPMGAPMASDMTPSAGGPGVSSSPSTSARGMTNSPEMAPAEEPGKDSSAATVGAALILPLLLLVASNLLF